MSPFVGSERWLEVTNYPRMEDSMRAWLITWEGSGNHNKLKNPIAAILSWRYSPERVRQLVEQIYINQTSTVDEQMIYAKNKKRNPYPAYYDTYEGANVTWQIYCGPNPYLHARLVEELCLERDENKREKLNWKESPRPKSKKLDRSLYVAAT
jgi:hypothetical protein